MRKEYKRIIKTLTKHGWSLKEHKKHFKVISPEGRIVSFSVSPSDQYAANNFLRDVNRVEREAGRSGFTMNGDQQ